MAKRRKSELDEIYEFTEAFNAKVEEDKKKQFDEITKRARKFLEETGESHKQIEKTLEKQEKDKKTAARKQESDIQEDRKNKSKQIQKTQQNKKIEENEKITTIKGGDGKNSREELPMWGRSRENRPTQKEKNEEIAKKQQEDFEKYLVKRQEKSIERDQKTIENIEKRKEKREERLQKDLDRINENEEKTIQRLKDNSASEKRIERVQERFDAQRDRRQDVYTENDLPSSKRLENINKRIQDNQDKLRQNKKENILGTGKNEDNIKTPQENAKKILDSDNKSKKIQQSKDEEAKKIREQQRQEQERKHAKQRNAVLENTAKDIEEQRDRNNKNLQKDIDDINQQEQRVIDDLKDKGVSEDRIKRTQEKFDKLRERRENRFNVNDSHFEKRLASIDERIEKNNQNLLEDIAASTTEKQENLDKQASNDEKQKENIEKDIEDEKNKHKKHVEHIQDQSKKQKEQAEKDISERGEERDRLISEYISSENRKDYHDNAEKAYGVASINDMVAYPDNDLSDAIKSMYSRIMDKYGTNLKHPTLAESIFHNPTGSAYLSGIDGHYKTYLFCTRPSCNMADYNQMLRVPCLHDALYNKLGRALLGLLQYPRREYLPDVSISGLGNAIRIEEELRHNGPFIPLFSNRATSSSNAPDFSLDVHNGPEDYLGSRWQYPTNNMDHIKSGQLTVNYDDMQLSPILFLHYYWVQYIANVINGTMVPDAYYIHNRLLDFTTSFYLIITYGDGRTIHSYCKWTGCWPSMVPFGYMKHDVDFSSDDLKSVSINYNYSRFDMNEPWILSNINALSMPYSFVQEHDGEIKDIPDLVDIRHLGSKDYPDVYTNGKPILYRVLQEYEQLAKGGVDGVEGFKGAELFNKIFPEMSAYKEYHTIEEISKMFFPLLGSINMLDPEIHRRVSRRLPDPILGDPLDGLSSEYINHYDKHGKMNFQPHRDPIISEQLQEQVYSVFQRADARRMKEYKEKNKYENDYSTSSYIGGNPIIINNRLHFV